jgi:hypothetical protein
MIRRRLVLAGAIVAALAAAAAGPNESWPQFRAPLAGVAENDPALPESWSATSSVVWTAAVPGMGRRSPLVWGDHVFHEVKTGREICGRQRISAEARGFTASPRAYHGQIFALGEDGDTDVIQAGPEFKVPGKNPLGEMALATPAISRGSLVIRTASKLYRVGSRS